MTATQKAIRAAVEATHKYETHWWISEQLDNIVYAYDREYHFSSIQLAVMLWGYECIGAALMYVVMS